MLYTIYKRTKKSGSFFYVTFYDEKTMKYGTAKSVDTLARELGVYKGHITKRPQAEEIVRLSIESGLDGTANKKTLDSSFVDYCLKFWDYDSSEFIQILNATNPGSIGRDYAHGCLLNIKNHVATVLPKDLKCSKVSAEDIERVQHKVLIDEKRSPQTWSNVLNSMRRPINELRRKKVLKTDPLFDLIKVRSVANKVSNVGALTQRESETECKYDSDGNLLYKVTRSRTKYAHPELGAQKLILGNLARAERMNDNPDSDIAEWSNNPEPMTIRTEGSFELFKQELDDDIKEVLDTLKG